MPNDAWKICWGPIPGLLLPQYTWHVLQSENVTTIDQLQSIADQIEKIVPGIGPKSGDVIRAELARLLTESPAAGRSRLM
ncbi:hypothetical protein [Microvirga subterranea]|uniref:Helix-hairpin-helix protein n=1 Tax=Microvirga subterranea TaxID=186651 RepID=A0A370HV63_9HYPH|nr:hypothetical protein [Microvirga subterranea]RDI61841.1 hypothetical protein DES45_10198 [Microvirga subterranea]